MYWTRGIAAVVGAGLLATGCGHHGHGAHRSVTTHATPTTTVAPVGESALKGLLLTADQVNAVMGATDMRVTQRRTELADDSATMEPRECLPIDGAGQLLVYENTGYIGVRGQTLREPDQFDHFTDQVVVLFPSAKRADAFLHIESELWPSCHRYTHTQSGSEWAPTPIANDNDMLSTLAIQQNAGNDSTWSCGRALTTRNNVVVDVNTCSADPKDSAVLIAKQIADRVPVD